MESNTVRAGGEIMVNANRQVSFDGSFSTTSITMLVAALLILLGIVFQLGELGYGHVSPSNYWFVSMITQSAWNLLALRTNGPVLEEVLRFWPIALVSVGLGILMLQRGRN
jgi:hypothetical protein